LTDSLAQWPPVLKLARAHHHLVGLKAAIQRFEQSDPAVVVPEFKPHRPGHNFRFVVRKEVPAHFGPWIGDVIYNLRAALDYAVYELTIAHTGHALDGTAFPVCSSQQQWDQHSRRTDCGFAPNTGRYKLRGVHPQVRASISRIQPFRNKRQNWPLLWLENLWNIDKHRTLHVVSTVPSDTIGRITFPKGGDIISKRFYLRRVPKHDAIVARFTYTKGITESDVHVEMEQSCALAFDEFPGQKPWGVIDALEAFDDGLVEGLLAMYSQSVPGLT